MVDYAAGDVYSANKNAMATGVILVDCLPPFWERTLESGSCLFFLSLDDRSVYS